MRSKIMQSKIMQSRMRSKGMINKEMRSKIMSNKTIHNRLVHGKLILIAVLLLSLFGCAYLGDKLLNPYSSEFQCPLADKGECIKLKDAYEKSLKQTAEQAAALKEINIREEAGGNPPQSQETRYQSEMFKKLAGLLSEPETPVIAAPKVMRVLFLPYKADGNVLMMPRFAYFFLDEPQWVLGGYLSKEVE